MKGMEGMVKKNETTYPLDPACYIVLSPVSLLSLLKPLELFFSPCSPSALSLSKGGSVVKIAAFKGIVLYLWI